jgi:cytochrome c oxidase accessory protein FixG
MKVIPITPVPIEDDGEVQGLYASEKKIYPRTVTGRFAQWRWAFVWLTQIIFYGLPWLQWGERQAVLFDLGARRFYIFGYVLYPQDFIYLTGLLVVSALSLFLFTAVAGRLWCGFACPQTVYTEMFLWIERKVEGDRPHRMKLDAAAFSLEKLVKKWFKHLLWGMLAMWTGFTFVGYFTPIQDLGLEFLQTRMSSWEVFWVFFYAFATYGNAGWMREQVCKYMCPYARFQSSMFDKDTLVITYDKERGDPRGARSKSAVNSSLGDCIDCSMCVQVCPTGIDIRNGMQYECIGCAACVDACNSVMDKVGSPRGLVRYSTDNAMKNKWSPSEIKRHAFRPRVLIYTSILVLIVSATIGSVAMRTPLKVDVIRDRGAMGREVEDGMIENVYRLQIMNTDERTRRFKITVSGIDTIAMASEDEIELKGTEARAVPVRVRVAHGKGEKGSNKIAFDVKSLEADELHVKEKAVFIVPR